VDVFINFIMKILRGVLTLGRFFHGVHAQAPPELPVFPRVGRWQMLWQDKRIRNLKQDLRDLE